MIQIKTNQNYNKRITKNLKKNRDVADYNFITNQI